MGDNLDIDRAEELADDATSEELVDTDTTEPELDSAEADEETDGEDRDEQGRFKKKKTAQDRINQLTAKQRQAERERDMEREINRRLTEQLEQSAPQDGQPPPSFDLPEPKLEEFNYDPVAHAQAHGKWEAVRDIAIKEGSVQKRNEVTEQVRRDSEWSVRKEDFAQEHGLSLSEFDAKTTSIGVNITPPMANVIKSSDNGPAMAYYLAENPVEADNIAALSPDLQAYRLGVIESKMQITPNRPKGLPPVPPAGGGGEQPNRNWLTDPNISTEDWIERRNKQVLDGRRGR